MIAATQAGRAEALNGRFGGDERLIVRFGLLYAGAFPPHVEEAAQRVGIIAVLTVVGNVIRVGENQHVVIGVIGAAFVKANDDLPMSGPVLPVRHDRNARVKLFQEIESISI